MKTIILGLALSLTNLIPGSTVHYERQEFQVMTAQVSAYTSSIDETDDTPHITASGVVTRHGIIACPARFQFGTKVEIEGRIYECQDRMAGRYRDGDYFDVWVHTKDEAYEWGRKNLKIKILL